MNKQIEFQLWVCEDDDGYIYASMLNEIFDRVYDNSGGYFYVNVVIKSYEEIIHMLSSDYQEEKADMILINNADISRFVYAYPELLRPFDDEYDIQGKFVPSAAAAVSVNGQFYGYPLTGNPVVLYYDPRIMSYYDDMLWDEFIEQNKGNSAWAFQNTPSVMESIMKTRGVLFYESNGSATMDGAFEVLELYAKLHDEQFLLSVYNDSITAEQYIAKLADGEYNGIIGDYKVAQHANGYGLAAVRIPKFNGLPYEANANGVSIAVIEKTNGNEDAIKELFGYLYDSSISAEIIASCGFLPVIVGAENYMDDSAGLGRDNMTGFFLEVLNDAAPIYYGQHTYELNDSLFANSFTSSQSLMRDYENFKSDFENYCGGTSGGVFLSYITIDRLPDKTEYYIYEQFYSHGMTVSAHLSSGASVVVYDYTCSPLIFDFAGKQNVTVSYTYGNTTKKAELPVNVKSRTLKGIRAYWRSPYPCMLFDEVKKTDIEAYAVYDVGQLRKITDFDFQPKIFETTGRHNIVVTYFENGQTVSCDLKVDVAQRVENIYLVKPPKKLMYANGARFDPTGMILKERYEDGTEFTVSNGSVKASPNIIKFKSGEQSKSVDLSITSYGVKVSTVVTVYKQTGAQFEDCNVTQDMGDCGKGTVNLLSGNLRYTFEDFIGSDTVAPIRIAHTYSLDNGNAYGVGENWRLNIQQEVIFSDGHWRYYDKEGKEYVFDGGFSSGNGRSGIRNEKTGLDLFTDSQKNTVTLIDRDNNSLVFKLISEVYRLIGVHIFPSTPTDPVDEYTMQIAYDGALPISVTAGRKTDNVRPSVQLIYANRLLSALKYNCGGETVNIVEYEYKGVQLLKAMRLNGNVVAPFAAGIKFETSATDFSVYDLSSVDLAGNYKKLSYKIDSGKVKRFGTEYTYHDRKVTEINYAGDVSLYDETTSDIVAYTYTEHNGVVSVISFCPFGVVSQYCFEKGDGDDGCGKPKTIYDALSRGFDYKSLADTYSDTLDVFYDDFEQNACGWSNGMTTNKYSVMGDRSLTTEPGFRDLQKRYTLSGLPEKGRTLYLSLWAFCESDDITVRVGITRNNDRGEFVHVIKRGLGAKWHFTAFCLGKLLNDDIIEVNIGSNGDLYIDEVRFTEAPYEVPDDIPDTEYDAFGSVTKAYNYDPVADSIICTENKYNGDRRLTEQKTTRNVKTINKVTYEYKKELKPDASAEGPVEYISMGIPESVKRFGKSTYDYTEEKYGYDGYTLTSANGTDNVTTNFSQTSDTSTVTVVGDANTPSVVTETTVYGGSSYVKSVRNDAYKTEYTYTVDGSLETARFGYDSDTQSYASRIGFEYDTFGNMSAATLGNVALVSLDYDAKHLNSITYANGCVVSYTYDCKDRITQIRENGIELASIDYSYDAHNTVTVTHANGLTYASKALNKDGFTSEYTAVFAGGGSDMLKVAGLAAREAGKITSVAYYTETGDTAYELCVTQKNDDGQIAKITRMGHGGTTFFDYDDLYRMKSKITIYDNILNALYATEYKYETIAGRRLSERVSEETFKIKGTLMYKHAYNYGKTGNLASVYKNTSKHAEYTYDKHNRLEWEHNYGLEKAVKYCYDCNGNITKKQEYGIVNGEIEKTPYKTDNYDYTTVTANSGQNSAWHDQLKSYNGNVIEYDAYGNPIVYKGKVLTWQGKKLATYDGINMEYDYNGNRIKKGNRKYYRYGDKLIFENDGNTKIYYYYDESGISGINVDGEEYYFKKNVLGDVEEIYDKHGIMLCRYIYDAWGKHRIYDTIGNEVLPEDLNIGNTNPIRYRGYYYDKEFKLYYLQSRYYDPDTCRFISPDGVEYVDPASVFGFNLYAYCNDNPVMYTDPSGKSVGLFLLGLLVGTLIGAVNGAIFSVGEDILAGFASGALSGLISTIGMGLALAIGPWGFLVAGITGAVSAMAGNAVKQGMTIGWGNIKVGLMIVSGVLGAITGATLYGLSSLAEVVNPTLNFGKKFIQAISMSTISLVTTLIFTIPIIVAQGIGEAIYSAFAKEDEKETVMEQYV